MKKTVYVRKGRTIQTIASGHVEVYASISLAKKASRKLQMDADGGLGRGVLMLG